MSPPEIVFWSMVAVPTGLYLGCLILAFFGIDVFEILYELIHGREYQDDERDEE